MVLRKLYIRIGFIAALLFCFQIMDAQYNFSQLDQVLTAQKRILGGNVSVLIYKNENIIYENNLGNYNKNTLEPIASCSKWLTAALVMTFVDEGKLSLEDNVWKYLPEFSKNGMENIKIKNCLSHTTGIESEPITLASLIARKKYKTLAEEVTGFASKPIVGESGQVFAYSSIGLNIAGRILEVLSGKDFETLFQERIAKPLEMGSTTFTNKTACNPSGGALSTASDYMKFLSMILHEGTYNGKQILSKKSIEMMQISRTVDVKVLYTPQGAEIFEYGFGEWIQEKDKTGKSIVVSSPGLFGTFPFIDLKRNYAAIVFVKNLKTKNRRITDSAIKNAIDQSLEKSGKEL